MNTSKKLLTITALAAAISAPVFGQSASDDELTRQFMESPSLDRLAAEFGKDLADFTVEDKKTACAQLREGSRGIVEQLPIEIDPTTTMLSVVAVYSEGVCSYTFGYVIYEDLFLKMSQEAMAKSGGTQYPLEFLETFYSTGPGYTTLQDGLRKALMADVQLRTLAQVPFIDLRATYAVVGDNIKGFELKLVGE
jgi:hypothetical protein